MSNLIEAKENITVNILDSVIRCTNYSTFNYKNLKMDSCFEWERIDVLNEWKLFDKFDN